MPGVDTDFDPMALYDFGTEGLDPSVTYCIEAQEIFEIGTHKGVPYKGGDINKIAANFARFYNAKPIPLLVPPAVIGHEEDQEILKRSDLPAGGWVTACFVAGTKLVVNIGEIPALVMYWIKTGRIRTVSAEIYEDSGDAGLPAGHGPTLRRVALLGGDIPQVKTLARLKVPTPERAGTAQFSEGRLRYVVTAIPSTVKFSEEPVKMAKDSSGHEHGKDGKFTGNGGDGAKGKMLPEDKKVHDVKTDASGEQAQRLAKHYGIPVEAHNQFKKDGVLLEKGRDGKLSMSRSVRNGSGYGTEALESIGWKKTKDHGDAATYEKNGVAMTVNKREERGGQHAGNHFVTVHGTTTNHSEGRTMKHPKLFDDMKKEGIDEELAQKMSDLDPAMLQKMSACMKRYGDGTPAPPAPAPAAPTGDFDRAAAIELIASTNNIDRAILEAKTDDELKALMPPAQMSDAMEDPTPLPAGASTAADARTLDTTGGGGNSAKPEAITTQKVGDKGDANVSKHSETAAVKQLETRVSQLQARIDEQTRREKLQALKAKQAKVAKFCETAIAEGKVTPAEISGGLRDLLMGADDANVKKFSDGTSDTELDRQIKLINARPKLHIFSEKMPGSPDGAVHNASEEARIKAMKARTDLGKKALARESAGAKA